MSQKTLSKKTRLINRNSKEHSQMPEGKRRHRTDNEGSSLSFHRTLYDDLADIDCIPSPPTVTIERIDITAIGHKLNPVSLHHIGHTFHGYHKPAFNNKTCIEAAEVMYKLLEGEINFPDLESDTPPFMVASMLAKRMLNISSRMAEIEDIDLEWGDKGPYIEIKCIYSQYDYASVVNLQAVQEVLLANKTIGRFLMACSRVLLESGFHTWQYELNQMGVEEDLEDQILNDDFAAKEFGLINEEIIKQIIKDGYTHYLENDDANDFVELLSRYEQTQDTYALYTETADVFLEEVLKAPYKWLAEGIEYINTHKIEIRDLRDLCEFICDIKEADFDVNNFISEDDDGVSPTSLSHFRWAENDIISDQIENNNQAHWQGFGHTIPFSAKDKVECWEDVTAMIYSEERVMIDNIFSCMESLCNLTHKNHGLRDIMKLCKTLTKSENAERT